jgi:hypothetical protein
MEEAERELEAAKRLSEVRVAAKKLNRARAELQWSDDETKQRPTAASRARDRSSA